MEWLRNVKLENPLVHQVYAEHLSRVVEETERVRQMDLLLEEVSKQEPYREAVGWLRCFHAIDTVTAMSVVSELYGIERFGSESCQEKCVCGESRGLKHRGTL